MDPFSLITGLAGLISLAIEVTRITSDFCSSAKGAPKYIHELLEELTGLTHVLEQLDNFLKTQDNLQTFTETSTLVSSQSFCMTKLKELYEKLRRLTEGGKLRRTVHALSWPFQEKENGEIILSLHRCAQTFQLALSIDQCALLSQTVDKVEEVLRLEIENLVQTQKIIGTANEAVANSLVARQSAVELLRILNNTPQEVRHIHRTVDLLAAHQQDSRHREILRWLTNINPSENQNDAQRLREGTTGEWLLEEDLFKRWRDDPGSLLWLHGVAGCGKTIICSTVIQYLQRYCQTCVEANLAYFYFDFADQANFKRKADGFLQSMIKQLSTRKLHQAVVSLYEEHKNGSDVASNSALQGTLKSLFQDVPATFVVLDALDECIEKDEVIQLVALMKEWGLRGTHIMVTSRWEKDIEEGLEGLYPLQITVVATSIRRDLEQYIDERISRNTRLRNWCARPELHQQIRSTLLKGANGMFRWVACHLDGLEKCVTRGDLLKELKHLPPGLDKTYERILRNLEPSHRDLVIKILQWLLFSQRPMTIGEVAAALAISTSEHRDSTESDVLSNELSDPAEILYVCPSLVKLVGRKQLYAKDSFVQLAHFSVKDYLLSSDSVLNTWYPGFKSFAYQSNMSLAESCLAYLLQFSNYGSLTENILKVVEEKPMALYAADYWCKHAYASGKHCNWDKLLILGGRLLRPSEEVYLNWLRLRLFLTPRSFNEYPQPIYLMAQAGLKPLVKKLLDNGAEVDALGGSHSTALCEAALNGDADIVHLLLAAGASVRGVRGTKTPLAAAASKGHVEIVEILIAAEKGDLTHREDKLYLGKALCSSARNGHEDCVSFLLKKGADMTVTGGSRETAVHVALSSGCHWLIPLFLKHSPEIIHLKFENTPLTCVVRGGSVKAVQSLLDAGADVEELENRCAKQLLLKAAATGSREIVTALLDHNAKINHVAGFAGSALGSAIYGSTHCNIDLVKLLLERGADPNIEPGVAGSALALAVQSGNRELISLLIKKGADIRANQDALAAATRNGDLELTKMLLNEGIGSSNLAGSSETFASALHEAVCFEQVDIVRLLLDHSKDDIVNLPPSSGRQRETPLMAAASRGNLTIARLLIDKGANVNYAHCSGTALSCAVLERNEEVAAYLLQCGADDTDMDGFSYLPKAARHGFLGLVEKLLQRGIHPDIRDTDGNTALHIAAKTGKLDVIRLLLRYQADINAHDNDDNLPLHLAAAAGHIDSVLAILNEGKQDIDIKDSNGLSALLIAVVMGWVDLVEALLALGTDTGVSDNKGATAMHLAANSSIKGSPEPFSRRSRRYGRKSFRQMYGDGSTSIGARDKTDCAENKALRIGKLLIGYGADIDRKDKNGTTPLLRLAGSRTGKYEGRQWTPRDEVEETIHFLVENGAMIERRDFSGRTILHHTARLGLESRMRWLLDLECRLEVECQDAKGRTAFLVACKKGHEAIVRLLLDKKSDCTTTDYKGWSPLDHAAAKLNLSIMRLILDTSKICTEMTALRALDYNNMGKENVQRFQCVKLALDRGASHQALYRHNQTLLHRAAIRNNLPVMMLGLEEYGLDVNTRDDEGKQALHLAARYASPRLLEYLLKRGCHANMRDLNGRTALHLIVGNFYNVEILLRHGANPKAQDNYGRTPLHNVAGVYREDRASILSIAKILLAHGASAIATDRRGLMPIDTINPGWYETDTGLALLQLFVEYGTNMTQYQRRDRVLLPLAKGGHVNEMALLLEEGAKVDSVDKNWRTALHIASSRSDVQVAKLLLSHGASAKVLDKYQRTALHHAAEIGSKEMIELLLTHGLDVNSRDYAGWTALHFAVHKNSSRSGNTVDLLLTHGSNIASKDRKGRTALHLAACKPRNHRIIERLLKNGAEVNVKDLGQRTPWGLAAKWKCKRNMAVLIRHGASITNELPGEVTEDECESSLDFADISRSDSKSDKHDTASLPDLERDRSWLWRRRSS